jgi:hypothetical protein
MTSVRHCEVQYLAHSVVPLRGHDRFTFIADSGTSTRLPSRPGEFHPEPLTDPDRILSHHPARAIARRLPPPVERRALPGEPVGPNQRR